MQVSFKAYCIAVTTGTQSSFFSSSTPLPPLPPLPRCPLSDLQPYISEHPGPVLTSLFCEVHDGLQAMLQTIWVGSPSSCLSALTQPAPALLNVHTFRSSTLRGSWQRM